MKWKNLAVTGGAVMGGEWVFQKFVLKDPTGTQPGGFINRSDGFGMDDVAHAATILIAIAVSHMVFKTGKS
jgi:hypothetical protein